MKKFLLALTLLVGMSQAMPAGSRVTLPTGQKIFVSGMNLAWINYGNDVGNTPLDTIKVNAAMKDLQDSGANAIRIWLSTDATHDPVYGSNGLVSGPATQTVSNIKAMLKLAKRHNLVLCLTLMTHNWTNKGISATILANNINMLTTTAGLNAYITNYLTPVVTAIGNDPNILCWEVFNEPEGMVQGWSSPANTVTQAQVQTAVNKVAAAIHAAVPQVLVSNGAASLSTWNWYTDAALKSAGGAATGTLDFYMVHYYGWNGTSSSPFTKSNAAWSFDKPMVIGEYASSDWSTSTSSSSKMQDAGKVDTLLTYLDKAGYAGGMGWQYQPDAGDPWMLGFATFGHSLRQAYKADSNSIKLGAAGNSSFSVSIAASNGGSVTASVAGRVDSGKADTIKAVASTGYSFSGWTGDTAGTKITGATLVIAKVAKDYALQANFTPDAGTNLIKGGTFTTTADQANWELGIYPTPANAGTVSYTAGQAAITITATDTTNYGTQLRQGSIQIDSLATYLVTFDASASAARDIAVTLTTGDWKWQSSATASLTTTKTSFTVELTSNITTAAGLVQFCVGKVLSSVTIDNVTMTRKSSSILPHAGSASSASWSLVRNGASLAWTRSDVVRSGGTMRLVDASGQELSRSSVPAGARSGTIAAPAFGIAFLVLETADLREVKAVSPVR